jgi:acyl-CoA synthetase (AMP-forming)/AMP-acid ligase II
MSKHFVNDEKLDFRITDVTKSVKLNINPDNETSSIEPITVPQLLNGIAEKYGQHPALKYKDPGSSEWNTITYAEYKSLVEKVAKVFIKLGLKQYGTVAILAGNNFHWHVSSIAAIYAG